MGTIHVIGGTKGGTSKTTLSENLAVALCLDGKRVVLVDCDGNANASKWAQRRVSLHPEAPRIECLTAAYNNEPKGDYAHKLVRTLRAISEDSEVVADCGGYDNPALRSALGAAGQFYVPLRPGQHDLDTATIITGLVDTARAVQARHFPAFWIPSQAETNPFIQDELEGMLEYLSNEELSAIGTGPTNFGRRSYREAAAEGLGVLEMSGKKHSKAKAEIQSFYELCGTGVVPHSSDKGGSDALSRYAV